MDTPELLRLLESGDIQLFDVREPEELEETGRIPRAVNLPREYVKLLLMNHNLSHVKCRSNSTISHKILAPLEAPEKKEFKCISDPLA